MHWIDYRHTEIQEMRNVHQFMKCPINKVCVVLLLTLCSRKNTERHSLANQNVAFIKTALHKIHHSETKV